MAGTISGFFFPAIAKLRRNPLRFRLKLPRTGHAQDDGKSLNAVTRPIPIDGLFSTPEFPPHFGKEMDADW